ncbi:MAG TPA: YggS family pyridoxal phosphate-dependent enzyme [Ilumatobacteraceae bacterium]|nr:YggS family pyridoxal phosphate-dependent enzyme [Ilumatobacteraceae bacterium]
MMGIDAAEVQARLVDLRVRIDAVERRWSHRVAVVGVTKGFGPEAIDAAVAAECDAIGENYAQELVDKREVIERLRPEVHFIGRLQRNKVRQLVGLVDVWCSLDRASVVDEVAKRAPGAHVLVQVDTSGDPAKGGCALDEAPSLVGRAIDHGLIVRGLMTVGPTGRDVEAARSGFRRVRMLVDRLGLDECSMGMSADLEVAVEEGSTQVRVGTALFGERPPRATPSS